MDVYESNHKSVKPWNASQCDLIVLEEKPVTLLNVSPNQQFIHPRALMSLWSSSPVTEFWTTAWKKANSYSTHLLEGTNQQGYTVKNRSTSKRT